MTDHRAEAEKWLGEALEPTPGMDDALEDCTLYALVGIGHAILASLGSNRPYDFDVDDPASP
jgi:hypothetical protein